MAGHGFHMVRKVELERVECLIENGVIITYEEEWEGDWKKDEIKTSLFCECASTTCKQRHR